ncbi:MAG: SLBB domain-containing protein [Marinilabiliales bacterium]|nr:SLBB domain-containing protein [Marinilabiliales bacterium]
MVTVTGKSVRNPGNFLVRIGTPVTSLIQKLQAGCRKIPARLSTADQ